MAYGDRSSTRRLPQVLDSELEEVVNGTKSGLEYLAIKAAELRRPDLRTAALRSQAGAGLQGEQNSHGLHGLAEDVLVFRHTASRQFQAVQCGAAKHAVVEDPEHSPDIHYRAER